MKSPSNSIYVYAEWWERSSPIFMGVLYTQFVRGKELFSFEFSPKWLESGYSFMLDPDLQLFAGRQYPISDKKAFGIFLDSAPDRWGRQLIRRREAVRARHGNRQVRQLMESDYLLGLHDITRMGALRFKRSESGEFLSNESGMPAPPWTSLRELEAAIRHYEEESLSDSDHEKWLNMLIAPGSSLGGARPKANVTDESGSLWIAKFPSRSDDINVGAWEMVCHRLARQVALNVPECRIDEFSGNGSTFLSKRFDRVGAIRIHFASAMTLLGRNDGDDYEKGCSYLDLAQFIIRHGANPIQDLEQLWKRIVFNVAVSNTDDHLRNHGFLLAPKGWVLSPAYDINPNPHGVGLTLNITEEDNSLDYELVMSIASLFRVGAEQASNYLKSVKIAVNNWREVAGKLNIPRRQIDEFSPAFRC